MQFKRWSILGLGLIAVLVDRGMKALVFQGSDFTWGWMHVHLIKNFGLVFSLPVSSIGLFLCVSVAVLWVLWLAIIHWRTRPDRSAAALLILFGASSNILDRIRYGFVIDWADFGRWFPVMNGADVVILIGIFTYLWVGQLTKPEKF